jgi:hypothetical protein
VKSSKTNFQMREGKVWIGSNVVSPDYLHVARHLDAGANGAVFEATDVRLERVVALKLWHHSVVVRYPDRALAEMRRNASLDHPSFVTVHDCGITNGVPYMVMQLVHGQSVKSWLNANPPFEKRYAVWRGFVHGISFAYSRSKLHGDPHTGNILVPDGAISMVDVTGRVAVKLADMGTSHLRKSRADFVARECKVLKETCERLFPEYKPDLLLDERTWLIPTITLDALDSYVEVIFLLRRAATPRDDHQSRSNALGISAQLYEVPLFRLDAVWQQILDLRLSLPLQAAFLGFINREPIPGSISSWDTSPIDPARYPEVLARYQDESRRWWQERSAPNPTREEG